MQAHLLLPVESMHFNRWLQLFEETAVHICPPAAAAHFIERARRIAENIEMGIASQRGVIRAPRRQVPVHADEIGSGADGSTMPRQQRNRLRQAGSRSIFVLKGGTQ